ncbi:MAG: hypothetical protein V2J26_05055 [Pacificimonas sp.]|jgi:hypothetical protein|nr:hypothetical protein [Pacificimonas sp.]
MADASKSGRTTYPKIGVWYAEDDGHIRLSIEGQGLTSVSSDPNSERYHRTLYNKLAAMLKEAGAVIPEDAEA